MLKIKNEIDLTELENFGFEYDKRRGRFLYCNDICDYVYVNSWDREVGCDSIGTALNVLYDIIQAGLVEKIDIDDEQS